MTDGFYRFPAMAKLEEWDNVDQITKIQEEISEASNSYWNNERGVPYEYGVELMDVIHAAETALRMNFNDAEIENLHALAIEKNRKRGFYKEE